MVKITQPRRLQGQIPRWAVTRGLYPNCAIFCSIGSNKKFVTTKKTLQLYKNVKAIILDVSASFRKTFGRDPNLDTLVQTPLTTQQKLQDYKIKNTPTKQQKSLPTKLVHHIHRKKHSHLSTYLGKLFEGDFLFGMRYCYYSNNPQGETKITSILKRQK